MEQNISLLILVLLPVAGASAVYALRRRERLAAALADMAAAAECLLALVGAVLVFSGRELAFHAEGFMSFGLHLQMDSFRAIYLVILTFMWLASVLFSKEYMRRHENKARFSFFTLLTLGATAGVFLSADLMTMFVFFEIMSFTSYTWVAQEETRESLKAAGTYLAVAVLGGMVLLMGLFLLYHEAGTLLLSELREACLTAGNQTLLLVSGCLMLFGFGAKAGMFPLHIWLPKAHPEAPAPASALLSGILTKCGIFGIIITAGSVLYQNETFGWIILICGTITMLVGAVLGIFSINIKRILACSSVSQVGFILVGLGMMDLMGENSLAVHGAFLHMVNHSLIKLVLFLLAGVVYQNLHTLDLTEIKGFGRKKPFFLAAFLSAAAAICGIPAFSGYISKTLLHEAVVEGGRLYAGQEASLLKGIEWVFLFSGGMTIAYMLKLFTALFLDEPSKKAAAWQGNYLSLPVKCLLAIPAALFFLFGIMPGKTMAPLASAAGPFFYGQGAAGEETIPYFSFGNLRGAFISIFIGLALYFGIVRTWMAVKEGNAKVYVDRLPKWMDLEELVYRPLFIGLLPFLCAVACRLLDKLVGGIAVVCSATVLAEKKPKDEIYMGKRITYFAGRVMDYLVFLLNRTLRKKKPIKRSYVKMFAIGEEEISRTARLIARSVSYGLMLACIGLLMTMLYLLFI